jgi:hypothetical protein
LYLILYILMRYDTCAYIKKTNYFWLIYNLFL